MYNEDGDTMLENLKSILNTAKTNKYAVPHFNINNLEWTKYILEECNKLESPVILGVSESAIKYMGGYKTVASLVTGLIEDLNIKVPVCLHLDHGKTIESCKKALEAGFKSVMIDASNYELEENIKITKEVVKLSKKYEATVEAEIGVVGEKDKDAIYASTQDSIKLVKETNIDALAPALGSCHGLYKDAPKINYERMEEISKQTNIPLVLHGATGLDDETIKKSIECGTTKININTELQLVWSKKVREYLNENKEVYDPRKIISSGEEEIKKAIKTKLEMLGSIGKSQK